MVYIARPVDKHHFMIVTDKSYMFCNQCLVFVIRNDRKRKFQFSAFDSDFFIHQDSKNKPKLSEKQSVVFIDNRQHLYLKSDAILAILYHLSN